MTREALSGSIYLLPMIEIGNSPHRKSDCYLIEASFIFYGFSVLRIQILSVRYPSSYLLKRI
jgi:hypothetical protein